MGKQPSSFHEFFCSILLCAVGASFLWIWYSSLKERVLHTVAEWICFEHVVMDQTSKTYVKKSIFNVWILFDFIIFACLCHAKRLVTNSGPVDFLEYVVCFLVCILKQKMEQIYPCPYDVAAVACNMRAAFLEKNPFNFFH